MATYVGHIIQWIILYWYNKGYLYVTSLISNVYGYVPYCLEYSSVSFKGWPADKKLLNYTANRLLKCWLHM